MLAESLTNQPPVSSPLQSPREAENERQWQRQLRMSRAFEFVMSLLLLAFGLLFSLIDVHDRPIPSIKIRLNSTTNFYALDPTINQEKLHEQVPMWLLLAVGISVPIVVNLTINYVLPRCRHITNQAHDTRDFLLSMLQAIALSQVLTQFIKNQTGRFRPSFYDMCGWQFDKEWDGVTNLCTDASGEKEARKSFPSGHSSFAWSTMLLLTLYLLGRSRLNALNRGDTIARGGRKTFKLFVCFIPTLIATWVAITRSVDNWHHYSDILAGSIIGAVSACIGYFYNYGGIFGRDTAGVTLEEMKLRYRKRLLESESSSTLASDKEDFTHAARPNGDYMISMTGRSRETSAGILV